MNSEYRHPGQRHLLRTPSVLFVAAVSRAGKYPVATMIGIALTYASSRALTLVPTGNPFLCFVRTGTGFTLGMLVLATLITLGAMRGVDDPKPLPILFRAIIWSTAIGFVAAIPVVGLSSLAPEFFVLTAVDPRVMRWLNVSIVALGALWAVSAGIDTPIAWAVHARHCLSLRRSFLVANITASQIGVSGLRLRIAVLTVGTVFALIPYCSLLAVTLLSHLCLAAFENWLDDKPGTPR